jgi:hypothetical protein
VSSTRKLLNLLNIKELYLSIKEYAAQSKIEGAIDSILTQIDQQINDLTGQLKLKHSKIES